MTTGKTRREFLQRLGGILAAGAGVSAEALLDGAFAAPGKSKVQSKKSGASQLKGPAQTKSPLPTKPQYKISAWTGDDFTLGHKFRVGDLPAGFPSSADKTVDFIIIGGGLAGLSTAYYLRDHDFLLLEQYDRLGGQARGGDFNGLAYSWGPAFVTDIEGIYGELYSALGISPVKLPAGDNSFLWQKHWYQGTSGSTANSLYAAFKKLSDSTASLAKALPANDTPSAMEAPDCLRLDGMPFSELLKGYSPEFTALMDSVSKSATCGTSDQISALAGLYLLDDLNSANYVFKGGNPAITTALANNLKNGGSKRLESGAFVWKVMLSESGAEVFYSSADGSLHRAACKHVIIATPPMVAWRQVPNMDDRMKANLMQFKYGSYLVANCLLDKKLFNSSYDNFVGPPLSFSDLIVAETPYELDHSYNPQMGSVLTVYRPWEPGSEGRTLLMEGNRQAFAKTTYDQLSQFIEHLDTHLKEVVLTRWGHALVVPGVNYYARLRKIMNSYKGPYSLAHSSTQGFPCAESAIRAGKFASDRALNQAAKTSWVVTPVG